VSGQSPIDLSSAAFAATSADPVRFHYPSQEVAASVCFTVCDGDPGPGGTTLVPEVVVTPEPCGARVEADGLTFELQSFHWHTPSEHLVEGRAAPLELHLVHRAGDALLVAAVLSVTGAADPGIAPAFDPIGRFDPSSLRPGESQCSDARFVLDDLLPAGRSVLRYGGSLTTAPFTEGVAWVVFSEPREASPAQVAAHHRLVSCALPRFGPRPNPPGNARPVQDLAGRRLFGDRMVGSLPGGASTGGAR
jgi:carbonic anhydrase